MDEKIIKEIKGTMTSTLILVIDDLKDLLNYSLRKESDKKKLSKCIETLKVVAACDQIVEKLGEKNVNP